MIPSSACQMINIHLIGHRGLIGSRLKTHLQSNPQFHLHYLERGRIPETPIDVLVYAAGMHHNYQQDIQNTIDAHAGFLNTLLHTVEIGHLIYLSSTRIWDAHEIPDHFYLPLEAPQTLYSLTKLTGEWLTAHHPHGSIVRLSNVYGHPGFPSRGFLMETLKKSINQAEIHLNSHPQSSRDYVYIEDVIQGLTALIEQRLCGTYTFSQGVLCENEELGAIIQQLTKTRVHWNPHAPLQITPVIPSDLEHLLHTPITSTVIGMSLAYEQLYLDPKKIDSGY